MIATLPRLTRKQLLAAGTGLIALALVLPFTGEYRPLGERMAQRYAENLDRSATEQSEADQQRQDAALRQRGAEQERQRAATSFDSLVAEFRRILRTRRPPVVATVANANKALDQIARSARQPDFYAGVGIRPEEASRLACTDPAGTLDMLHRESRRDHNILACTVYLALHRGDSPEPAPQVAVALLERLVSNQEAGHFPLQSLISYVWMRHLTAAAIVGQPPGPFPELNSGEALNPALLRDALPPSFARRLIETGTDDEKLEVVTHAYPDLRRMAELGEHIAQACQLMKRTPCLTAK